MCVPPSGPTLFKSIKQAKTQCSGQQTAVRPLEVRTLSSTTHPGQNTQGRAENVLQRRITLLLTTSDTRDSHSARHISSLIISLPGGYSLTSVSSAQCRLNANPSNIRQPLWIYTLDVHPSPWIHFAQSPSPTPDTRHLRPPMNYTEALRSASGLAFMGVQI